jgi:hypothetical protein
VTVDDDGLPVEVRPSTGTVTGDDTPVATRRPAGPPPSSGRITEVLEVWRIDDEWWRVPITRRYVDVVLDGGAHVVLFEDLQTGEWFVQQP